MTIQLLRETPIVTSPKREQLDALTALRFFAAAAIAIYHSLPQLSMDPTRIVERHLALWHAVAFFFILSGFILTRVYQELPSGKHVFSFWTARFARIWPMHILCALLAGICSGVVLTAADAPRLLATGFLVQAWMCDQKIYTFLNSPSWTLSTEVFFYLSFPLLLILGNKRPAALFGLGVALLVAVLGICQALGNAATLNVNLPGVLKTLDDLVYVCPLTRLFDFITGICLAIVLRRESAVRFVTRHGTRLGSFGIVMLIAALLIPTFLTRLQHSELMAPVWWLWYTGGVLPYALLIGLVATLRGPVNRFRCQPWLVRFGQISFALYLVHSPILVLFKMHAQVFASIPTWGTYVLYWLVILVLADLLYAVFETPMRNFIAGGWRRVGCRWSLRPVLELALLLIIWAGLQFNQACSEVALADRLAWDAPYELVGTRFADCFELQGAIVKRSKDGCEIELGWKQLAPVAGEYVTAVHLVDSAGNIKVNRDFVQEKWRLSRALGQPWSDVIKVSAEQMNDVAGVAIGIFPAGHPLDLLVIDRGLRDWGNRRLIMPLAMFRH